MARRWRVMNRRRRRVAEIGPKRCVCRSLDVIECRLYPWKQPHRHLCSTCAVKLGFCCSCGLFCGGMESFDFGGFGRQPGYCDRCWDQIMADYDWDRHEDEDGYDWYDDDRWRAEEAFLWP